MRVLSNSLRATVLAAITVVVLALTFFEAVSANLDTVMPGPMSRHRDSIAVAITYAKYGVWDGYGSYKAVVRTLRESGLSVHQEDTNSVGAGHYFDVMTDPAKVEAALDKASNLADPASEGMFYMQDEKGMGLLYLFAFTLFGVGVTSWFKLYMLLFSTSVLLAVWSFRREPAALSLILFTVCLHLVMTLLLPSTPKLDINIINGNRFLGIFGLVPLFHLTLCALYRVRPTFATVFPALVQIAFLVLIVNARSSAVWLFIAALALVVAAVVWAALTRRWAARPAVWPALVVVAGIAAISLHNQTVLNDWFSNPQGQQGHVFWHSLLTALHNNPERTERYGIPAAMPAYDDQVSYILFNREIERRGEQLSDYLVGDADWIYRTSAPELDFRWDAYDQVLRDVFLKTVAADPGYAARSFLLQQPLTAWQLMTGPGYLQWSILLHPVVLAAVLLGLLLAAPALASRPWPVVVSVSATLPASALPVLAAAVAELRIAELFATLILSIVTLLVVGLSISIARSCRTR